MTSIPVIDVSPRNRAKARPTRIHPTFAPAPAHGVQPIRKPAARTLPSIASMLGLRALGFASIAAVVYLGGAFAGQVALERVRDEGNVAHDRAVATRQMETELQTRINELTNPGEIENWAATHGFVAGGR